MTICKTLMRSVNARFFIAIPLILLLYQPVPGTDAASREQVAEAYALARPVLRDGASDAALMKHLESLGGQGSANIVDILYFVFRESVAEQNEDKKYWLSKLKMYNDIQSALAEYLKELNDAMKRGNGAGGSAGLPIAQADAALQKFEAKLAVANLPAAEKQSLQGMAAKDRRLFQNARLLEQRVRAIARTQTAPPAPAPHDASPRRSTGPKIPARQAR